MPGDPCGGWNKDCHFAQQVDCPDSTNSGIFWLGSSSSSLTSSSDVVPITICSAPGTPESHQEGGAATPQPEDYRTPPEVAIPTSASSDDAGEEGSPDRKREREESESSLSKKLKDSGELGFLESNHEVQGTVVLDNDGSNLMKFVLNALKNLSQGNQERDNDEPIDILETAKQRGMTFPKSRWHDQD